MSTWPRRDSTWQAIAFSATPALGVGASVLPGELSAERLASALDEVTRPPTRERAAALAPQIAPDGANGAARMLSELET